MDIIEKSIISRITRDLTDAIMLIDVTGSIVYFNPKAREVLAREDIGSGMKYAQFMADDESGQNDEFHQFVLDSVYDKESTHKGTVNYTCPDGSTHVFQIDSSFAFSDDLRDKIGVILQFSDVTQENKLRIKYKDAEN